MRRLNHISQSGFSIIELLVAVAIGLLILLSVSGIFLNSLFSEKTNDAAAEILTNGRYAIEVLRKEALHAGYLGISSTTPNIPTTNIGTVASDCGVDFAVNLSQPVWGTNDTNSVTACVPNANYRTGDIFTVRHAALTATTVLDSTTLYLRSAYERTEVFKGSNPPASFTQLPNFNYAVETSLYYVSPFTNDAAETPLVPALYRVSLSAGPAMTRSLVASNIEDMQIQYGRTDTAGNTRFYNADQINSAATSTEWSDVVAVRIWLLVRATAKETNYTNTNTYALGDKNVTVNDGFRRQVFSTVVQLRNF